jgi:hypothetical protein
VFRGVVDVITCWYSQLGCERRLWRTATGCPVMDDHDNNGSNDDQIMKYLVASNNTMNDYKSKYY